MTNKKYVSSLVILALALGLSVAIPAFAENSNNSGTSQEQKPVVVGTVTAISGNTITVVNKQDSEDGTVASKTYTVNATGAKIIKNGVTATVSNIAVGDSVKVQGTVNGTNVTATTIIDGKNSKEEKSDSGKMMPAVVGKVSAISGNLITVISKQGFNKTDTSATKTFVVDAAPGGNPAKLLRGNTAITLANIAVGDTIIVQGTVNGTNIAATMIRDGKVGNGNESDNNQALLQIQGNGQPVIAGTVSAINGSVLTVANSSVTYTVEAANAKILQGKNTIAVSGVKVGDSVIVQGTVNGTSITASTIIDQKVSVNDNGTVKPNKGIMSRMMESMGNFFRRMFGF